MSESLRRAVRILRRRMLGGSLAGIEQRLLSEFERIGDLERRLDTLSNALDEVFNGIDQVSNGLGKVSNDLHDISLRQLNSGTVRLSETELATKLFSGIIIFLDPRDISVTPHIAVDYIWEYQVTRAWLSVIHENDVVFDVGANFGYYGAIAA